MSLAELPEARLTASGVQFRYLVLRVAMNGEEKTVVRGVNYRPYLNDPDDLILQRFREELEMMGVDAAEDSVAVVGGGGLSRNPYYETLEVFGRNERFGPEENRELTVQLLQKAYPEFKVNWYAHDHFEVKEREEAEKKAAATAKAAAAKAAKAKAEKARTEEAKAQAQSDDPKPESTVRKAPSAPVAKAAGPAGEESPLPDETDPADAETTEEETENGS